MKNMRTFCKLLLVGIIIILNIGTGTLLIYEFGIETTSVTNILDTSTGDENTYFVVKNNTSDVNVKIECDEFVAKSLLVDDNILYEMEYRYLKNDRDRAIMGSIDICNPIDNRNQ